MRSLTVVTLLILAVPVLVTGGTAARATEEPLLGQPVFADPASALEASDVSPTQPIVMTPLGYSNGVALYRIRGTKTGETDYAFVSSAVDPTAGADGEEPGVALRSTEAGTTPEPTTLISSATSSAFGTCRCLIYAYRDTDYRNLILTTDLDLNALKTISGLNDSISSIRTTCFQVYFYEDTNFLGSILILPPNSSQPSLSGFNFNDKISAIIHINQ
jgi:hypothetical protein